MNSYENFKRVLKFLPQRISGILAKMTRSDASMVNEIRFRTNRPVGVSVMGKNYFVTVSGSFTNHTSLGVICGKSDIEEAFRKICDYSVHSFEKEISRGFITIEGGNRVGISGTAVSDDGRRVDALKYINGLNFRISSEAAGAGESLCGQFFRKSPVSMLIVGEPLSGKTTLLKSMCRCLGEKYRISVIDERSEIAACYFGEPQNNVGSFTDVFDGFDKKNGIETAVRVMSPEIVVCDEIGGREDCEAIIDSVNSGVRFLAAVHGKSFEEVISRPNIKKLLYYGIFEYGVLLEGGAMMGNVKEVKRFRGVTV